MRKMYYLALFVALLPSMAIHDLLGGEPRQTRKESGESQQLPRVLILWGGSHHPFTQTVPILRDFLKRDQKLQVDDITDLEALRSERLNKYDVLLLSLLWWTGNGFHITKEQRNGLKSFVASGKAVVALHVTAASFNDWSEFADIIGGRWVWGTSAHEPYRAGVQILIQDSHHPITEGIRDFTTTDELYHSLEVDPKNHILLAAFHGQTRVPLGWVKRYDQGKVLYIALGHGPESYQNESFLRLVKQGVLWASGATGREK